MILYTQCQPACKMYRQILQHLKQLVFLLFSLVNLFIQETNAVVRIDAHLSGT